MKRLIWQPMALEDGHAIMAHTAHDNPAAARELDQEFVAKAGTGTSADDADEAGVGGKCRNVHLKSTRSCVMSIGPTSPEDSSIQGTDVDRRGHPTWVAPGDEP